MIGILWNTGIKNKQRISQFMKSLKKLVNEDKKILIFGDTNANPDIRYENCVEKKEEFLEKGYTDASIRTIAQNAGVSTSTIYTRYSDKEG